jgi:hypothetical protein
MSLLEKVPALPLILLVAFADPASAKTLEQIREECRLSQRIPGKDRQMQSLDRIKKCIQQKTKRRGKKKKGKQKAE